MAGAAPDFAFRPDFVVEFFLNQSNYCLDFAYGTFFAGDPAPSADLPDHPGNSTFSEWLNDL